MAGDEQLGRIKQDRAALLRAARISEIIERLDAPDITKTGGCTALAVRCFRSSGMTSRSKPSEPVHVDDAGDRRERLAALLVVDAAQSAMALRVGLEVHADASLSLDDRCAATGAKRTFRTATTARHDIESHKFPQPRFAPNLKSHRGGAAPIQFWRWDAGCGGKVGQTEPFICYFLPRGTFRHPQACRNGS